MNTGIKQVSGWQMLGTISLLQWEITDKPRERVYNDPCGNRLELEILFSCIETQVATHTNIYRHVDLHALVKYNRRRKRWAWCCGCTEGRWGIRKDKKDFSTRKCSRKEKNGHSRRGTAQRDERV